MALLTKVLGRAAGSMPTPRAPHRSTLAERGAGHRPVIEAIRAFDAGDATAFRAAFAATTTWGERGRVIDALRTERRPWVDEWVAAAPDEPLAWLVRGSMGVFGAWEVRGGHRSDQVEVDAWPRFFEMLRQADLDLAEAARLDPSSPLPWSLSIAAGMGLQIPLDEVTFRLDEVLRVDPHNLAAHLSYVQVSAGKWSGSDETMWSFAEAVHTHVPEGSPLRAVVADAAVERLHISRGEPSLAAEAMLLDAARASVLHPDFAAWPCPIDQAVALASFAAAFHVLDQPSELARVVHLADRWPTRVGLRYVGSPDDAPDDQWARLRRRIAR